MNGHFLFNYSPTISHISFALSTNSCAGLKSALPLFGFQPNAREKLFRAAGQPAWAPSVETKRGLLVAGNEKLSQQAFHFDLPAGRTCPGKSRLCHGRCYARKGRFVFPQVIERLNWCYERSKRSDFVEVM